MHGRGRPRGLPLFCIEITFCLTRKTKWDNGRIGFVFGRSRKDRGRARPALLLLVASLPVERGGSAAGAGARGAGGKVNRRARHATSRRLSPDRALARFSAAKPGPMGRRRIGCGVGSLSPACRGKSAPRWADPCSPTSGAASPSRNVERSGDDKNLGPSRICAAAGAPRPFANDPVARTLQSRAHADWRRSCRAVLACFPRGRATRPGSGVAPGYSCVRGARAQTSR